MPDVFISYAHQDTDKARGLVHALREKHIVGWLDSADIASGDAVSSAVRDALKKSDVVIVLLTTRAFESQWVQFEVGAAEALDKRIIPVVLSHFDEDHVPEVLRSRQWIDGRDRPLDDVARDVKRAVEAAQK